MQEGMESSKPQRDRRVSRSALSRSLAKLMENPRLAGFRRWLDGTTARLEAIERKIPPAWKKPVVRRSVVAVVLVVGGVTAVRVVAADVDKSLPDPKELQTFARPGTLTIRASDGTILHQLGPATREKLKIDQIPKRLIEAFIASEDRRFYDHSGVDFQGIARAIVRNFRSGEVVEGGSTLTQQLARIVYLNQDRSIGRKIREAMIAQKLERAVNKDQILEQYLNLVFLGSNAYGVADAAWVYFSKPVSQLTLSEMATIAGLPPAPSVYSPLENLDKARERRNTVLDRMVTAGYITMAEAEAAKAQPLTVKPSTPKKIQSDAPYFTYYVQQQVPKLVSKEALEAGGITVETSLNAKWQKVAEKAVRNTIQDDGNAEGFKQGALVAIDPRSGEVRAMVGGYDFYKDSMFNRATQAQRQPGSTFKSFVYATAIGAGFSPNQGYPDERFMVDGYQPKNYGNKYSGWQSMRSALTKSLNVVAVKVLIDVGFDPVIKLAQSMGIRSKLEPTYSMALGAYEVNLLELTSAYGTFAAQGNAIEPRGIRRILDRTGKILYDAQVKPKRSLDAESANIVTWMLRSVVSEGTGRPAQIDRPVAGKTGTSEQARDLWFIGYIPQLVTGVWLGNDDSSPTWGTSGTAAYTWQQFMKEAVKGMPVQKFPEIPDNIEDRKGTIKPKPVKPNRTQIPPADPSEESSSRERRYEEAPPEPTYYDPAPEERRRSDPPPEEPRPRAEEPPPADPAPAPEEPPASAPAPEPPPAAPADPAPPAADPLPPPGN
jgi:penicillin-binding protein 1A